jgi:hypothetical protein
VVQLRHCHDVHPCRFAVTSGEIAPEKEPLLIGIASVRVDPNDRLRYHKTSRREMFAAGRLQRPDCSEVIFLNNRGYT